MVTDTFVMSGVTTEKKPRTLEKIFLYDKIIWYPDGVYIQYLDSYKNDFVFVNDFPKVMKAMSEKMDKQDFRDMLKCAIQTNLKLYK